MGYFVPFLLYFSYNKKKRPLRWNAGGLSFLLVLTALFAAKECVDDGSLATVMDYSMSETFPALKVTFMSL
jgi:hypothetical protein